jgi:pyruvate formate lyase activating enzyme
MDVADACREHGIRSVAVSAGHMCDMARRHLYAHVDAANIDLEAFSPQFYAKVALGRLDPVLHTLRSLRHETDVWLETTTQLIPGHNDSTAEMDALTRWVAEELGPDVPLHFSAFHPSHKMLGIPPTPPATLTVAGDTWLGNGLRFVHTGNVDDLEGSTTSCPGCGRAVIRRDGYRIGHYALDDTGRCRACRTQLAGRFSGPVGTWGPRRMPVRLAGIVRHGGEDGR